MQVYDTANRLAKEIRESEEYNNFKVAKQTIGLNAELKNKIEEFEKARYEAQLLTMQGKNDDEKIKNVQNLYTELIQNQDASKYFEAEMKFNVVIADVNKIIGDSFRDLIK
ncbi:MAG: YlbF family regulator [Clostridia bacterium]|nr:YlbF family regulator [Clostridia bacterium]